MKKYNNLERPVANESEALVLKFGLTLQQIIDVVSNAARMRLAPSLAKSSSVFSQILPLKYDQC